MDLVENYPVIAECQTAFSCPCPNERLGLRAMAE
jgi:hypothetical protein